AGVIAAGTLTGGRTPQASGREPAAPGDASANFVLGLNTSTIRGQKVPITEEIDIAARAGFRGIEPWIDELKRYAEGGGSLSDLAKRFADAGISVESAIDFFEWAVDDESRRKKALEAARFSMELVRKIGGRRIAAPPVG